MEPGYLGLVKSGELAKRVNTLKGMLSNCILCPHQCEVNRLKGERGYCKTLEKPIVSSSAPHFGEEEELVGIFGSGTIFFSHCNLRCVFCQNYEISYCGEGEELEVRELANTMLKLQKKNCHNINLVSPGHVIPQIVEAIYMAAQDGLKIPIVYNTNGYDLTDSLKFLDGIIDIYMPDLKFAADDIAKKYLGVKNYYTIAKSAIKEMYRQVGNLKTLEGIAYGGIIIRHLVLPQNIAGTEEIMHFIAEDISRDAYVNIMAQYYPVHRAHQYGELRRRISESEYDQAVQAAEKVGLTNIHLA